MSEDFLTDVNTQSWANGRHEVQCVNVIYETMDVRTFCFKASSPVMHFFKPGQFVTFELEINGQQVFRSYTISSSPSVPYSFSVTIKRIPYGEVSNWMHDNLKLGDLLTIHGPVGQFNCFDIVSEKVLLLSGGVGITPLMSMSRWWYDTNANVDINFVHSARSPRDIIYHDELKLMDARIDNFNLNIVCQRYENGENWSGYTGFLDRAKLEIIAPDFMQRTVFCCGPAVYMSAIREMLEGLGFDMANYHEESFGSPPEESQVDAQQQADDNANLEVDTQDLFQVEFSNSGKAIKIQAEQTVHTAAALVGLHIPKGCGLGMCGTCIVKKTSGEVEMSHNGGITEEDVEDGYILSCCSIPKGDVSIEY
ncbi:hybrid-cluster NAD(P)-dependent oxidoreductase [uncultured Paraglaciecola sp.]|uniref:hybrid-cluster NAD(P)-dependent oxidoreductase n=1 Tax=uncultured Paraglaciecola sp. TaxID=1765024 RepID=UPI00259A6F8C|nr:hybrid-cluster NAD(P)-dependent oxidoreductase [uncultured Paraglaciecola sp.]